MNIRNVLIGCVVVLCSMSVPDFANAQPLTIEFNESTAKPFKWKEHENYVGPWLDIMRAVAERAGVEVELIPLPLKRVFKKLEDGDIAGAFGLYRKAEREKYLIYLDTPISWSSTNIFVQKRKQFSFEKLEDLYGKEIGILRGLSIGDEFDTAIREKLLTIQKVSSYEQNVKKLLLGRIDLTIAPGPTFQALIKEMGLSDRIVKLSHPVAVPRPLHIVFSKTADFPNKDDAIKTMGKTLQDMADRGELDKITQKYGYSYKP